MSADRDWGSLRVGPGRRMSYCHRGLDTMKHRLPSPELQASSILQRSRSRIQAQVLIPHLDGPECPLGWNIPKLQREEPRAVAAGSPVTMNQSNRRQSGFPKSLVELTH